jgi:Cu(I)/Ag(I) efflux system membrane protein CusA/SilA
LGKDGTDAVGGVVMMRHGENPLAVTRRLRAKIEELQPGLPPGVRVVPAYDRASLIEGAVGAVTGTLLEVILTANRVRRGRPPTPPHRGCLRPGSPPRSGYWSARRP